jgi:hypothetical protein
MSKEMTGHRRSTDCTQATGIYARKEKETITKDKLSLKRAIPDTVTNSTNDARRPTVLARPMLIWWTGDQSDTTCRIDIKNNMQDQYRYHNQIRSNLGVGVKDQIGPRESHLLY